MRQTKVKPEVAGDRRRRVTFSLGTGKDRLYFLENVSMLAASGMGMSVVLDSIQADMRTRRMREVVKGLRSDVAEGYPLWKALERSGLFRDHIISLVRVGEESGKLSENLHVVALDEEKERTFRSRLRSAMMYPLFVFAITIIVGIGVAWFILPRLSGVFRQLHLELPPTTRVLIAAGSYLHEYGNIVVPLFTATLIAAVYFLFFFPKTKHVGHYFLFRLPGTRSLMREVELARFGFLMGILIEAGIPAVEATAALRRASFFAAYRRLFEHIYTRLTEGWTFQKAFAAYPRSDILVPIPVQQMIAAAEQSGSLGETMKKIGELFEARTETAAKNLVVILEPLLLFIVWLGVVFVAIAVILPIYSLIGDLNV